MTRTDVRRRGPNRQWARVGLFTATMAACAFALLPLLWALATSLKPAAEVVSSPPTWIPKTPTFDNYGSVIQSNFPSFLLNSLVVSLLTIVLSLVVAAHAGYAFSRFTFRFKMPLLYAILASMMIARVSNIVPLYIVGAQTGLLDTKLILVLVYSGWQLPIAVWLLVDFFKNVPTSLDNAARVDGYGPTAIFYRVALPLVRPGLAAAAVVAFMFVWNDFILALTLTSSDSTRMVTVGLYSYVSQFGVKWGDLMAAVMVALIPVVIIFAMIQKSFISGMTSGGVKG